jgi:hypothetical protein
LEAQRADLRDVAAERGVGVREVTEGLARVERERVVAVEERRLPVEREALGREDPLLRHEAAVRGEPAGLAARGEHAMTRHEQGVGVLRHGAPDRARGAR